jgi:phage protein U
MPTIPSLKLPTISNPLPMAPAMLTLGLFVFQLDTLPYQTFARQVKWRHPTNSRVGATPGSQFVGRDNDVITLDGTLLPELTGGTVSLTLLEAMADQGKAWPLIEGTGMIYGMFVVEGLSTTRTVFFRDGAARKIDFQLSLKRVDDSRVDMLGRMTAGLQQLAGL